MEVEAAGSYLPPACAPGFLHPPLLWFQHLCVALGASYLVPSLQLRLVIEESLPLNQTSIFFFHKMPAITALQVIWYLSEPPSPSVQKQS